MTQWHRKYGRLAGDGDAHLTPFDLLRWLIDTGELEASQLFRQYAGGFFGRKQLSWTPNMRRELGMQDEVPDEELVQHETDGWEHLAVIDLEDWRVIARRELRGALLEVAAAGDPDRLRAWVGQAVR